MNKLTNIFLVLIPVISNADMIIIIGMALFGLLAVLLTKGIGYLNGLKKKLTEDDTTLGKFLLSIIDMLIELMMTILEVVKEFEDTERSKIKGKLSDQKAKDLHSNAFDEVKRRNKTVRILSGIIGKSHADKLINNGIHSVVKHLKIFKF